MKFSFTFDLVNCIFPPTQVQSGCLTECHNGSSNEYLFVCFMTADTGNTLDKIDRRDLSILFLNFQIQMKRNFSQLNTFLMTELQHKRLTDFKDNGLFYSKRLSLTTSECDCL